MGLPPGRATWPGRGIDTVIGAASDYDVASYSLEQIKQRQMELIKRRAVIRAQLK